MDGAQELVELNLAFGPAEVNKDLSFFKRHLADDLVFRRASGTQDKKDSFLNGLADQANKREYVHAENVDVIMLGVDMAFVSLLVWAKGIQGTNPIHGIYRNTRLFRREAHVWRCIVWYNTQVGPDLARG